MVGRLLSTNSQISSTVRGNKGQYFILRVQTNRPLSITSNTSVFIVFPCFVNSLDIPLFYLSEVGIFRLFC